MAIPVDFTGVEATNGTGPVAEGDHRCVIDSAKETKASTGTPGVEVALRIVGGDFDGRFVWDRIWFTDKAMGIARWKLQAAGLPIPEGQFMLEPSNLVGRPVIVTVKHEEYEGKTHARVKAWESAGGASPAQSATAANGDDIPF